MTDARTFAIVGAGLAGAKAAEALRTEGFAGRIVLLGAEPHRPYERPPLSKGYLQGSADRDTVYVHPPEWYAEHQVDLRLGTAVTAVDRRAHEIVTADGSRVRYDKLLLATGATPRRLPVPGADLAGRALPAHPRRQRPLKAALRPGARVVIIGGGLDRAGDRRRGPHGRRRGDRARTRRAAAAARARDPESAQVFADLHTDHGVDLRCGVTAAAIRAAGTDPTTAGGVQLADGTTLDADVIVVGIGVTPNVELARSCRLNVDNGILVDQHLLTSDDDICAAGDVANAYHPLLCRQLRVEHWANALNQPAVAATDHARRSPPPTTGCRTSSPTSTTSAWNTPATPIPTARPGRRSAATCTPGSSSRSGCADGRSVAGMNVNIWDVTEQIEELIRAGERVDPQPTRRPRHPVVTAAGVMRGARPR